ncbi:MAG TPA: multiheme c-type cytochrome [Gammaproteobacteria bacterium]|nr:multiheme c-type cytochrome [Gammaproteobacteria bacterium]
MDTAGRRLIVAGLTALCICSAAAAPSPDTARVHLGVASCAGSNCHGSNASRPPAKGVLHNEYLTWQRDDAHAGAYRSLLTARSLAIAHRLGIADPSESNTCLDCHSDDVSAQQRGPRFSQEDGIGCEACHGGSSAWIVDHAVAHRSHAVNLKEGIYPTEDPQARAALCLSCHYGASDKPMTHAIMAAGHPPLLFELATYTAIQPAHYRVDADYKQRKHYVGPADTWAVGQVVTAERVLADLAARGVPTAVGAAPDFYLYDCYSCHQPLQPEGLAGDVPPTDARPLPLALTSLHMVDTILAASDPGLVQRWEQALAALHAADTPAALADAIARLQPLAVEAAAFLSAHSLDAEARHRITLALARDGAQVSYPDRSLADQTVMAMTVLYHADSEAGETTAFGPQFPKALDAAYKSLHSLSEFEVPAYRSAMQDIEKCIKYK